MATQTLEQRTQLLNDPARVIHAGPLMSFGRGEPDVYEDVPADVYHALDAASASRLNKLRRSPLHCRYAIDNPDEDGSDAKALGTAGHACLLEPAGFESRYIRAGQCEAVLKTGKNAGQRCERDAIGINTDGDWCCGTHGGALPPVDGRAVLTSTEFDKLQAMHRAVWAHPAAARYLSEAGRHELSILWIDRETGVLCKTRLDRLVARGAVIDLKTTRDASPKAFARSVYEYGYHRQGAFNLFGAQAHGLNARAFAVIAVENEPPHAVGVYLLDDAAIAQGEREVRPLLSTWAECQRSGVWPGYADEPEILNLLPYHRDEEAGF